MLLLVSLILYRRYVSLHMFQFKCFNINVSIIELNEKCSGSLPAGRSRSVPGTKHGGEKEK